MFIQVKYENSWSWEDQFSTPKINLHLRYFSEKTERKGNAEDSGVVRKN